MIDLQDITFAAAVNKDDVLERNLLASPCLRAAASSRIFLQRHFSSAAEAYNDVLEKCPTDLVVFAHQDMYFPEGWIAQLEQSLDFLKRNDPDWGVLGCYGVTSDNSGYGRLYSCGLGIIGAPIKKPTPVRTLDEIVLILRTSSGLRFDSKLPGFHFYGSDICLRATQRGMNSYAIPAFCIHNTQLTPVLPPEFYECYRHFKRNWINSLPVHTSCITVSRFNFHLHLRRLREAYLTHIRRKKADVTRISSPQHIMKTLTTIDF